MIVIKVCNLLIKYPMNFFLEIKKNNNCYNLFNDDRRLLILCINKNFKLIYFIIKIDVNLYK